MKKYLTSEYVPPSPEIIGYETIESYRLRLGDPSRIAAAGISRDLRKIYPRLLASFPADDMVVIFEPENNKHPTDSELTAISYREKRKKQVLQDYTPEELRRLKNVRKVFQGSKTVGFAVGFPEKDPEIAYKETVKRFKEAGEPKPSGRPANLRPLLKMSGK